MKADISNVSVVMCVNQVIQQCWEKLNIMQISDGVKSVELTGSISCEILSEGL